uniref:Uncharacterized protein n=2 Tax=Anguilla anguilla TaxID=7936 RepID=A0A0E9X6M0_ANGAN
MSQMLRSTTWLEICLRSSRQMKPTISCRQPLQMSVKSGSMPFRLCPRLGNSHCPETTLHRHDYQYIKIHYATKSIWTPLGLGLFFMVWARPLSSSEGKS